MRRIFIAIGLFAAIGLSAQETETHTEDFNKYTVGAEPTQFDGAGDVVWNNSGMVVADFVQHRCLKLKSSGCRIITDEPVAKVQSIQFQLAFSARESANTDISLYYATDKNNLVEAKLIKQISIYHITTTGQFTVQSTEPSFHFPEEPVYYIISYYGDGNKAYIDDVAITTAPSINCDNCFEVTF